MFKRRKQRRGTRLVSRHFRSYARNASSGGRSAPAFVYEDSRQRALDTDRPVVSRESEFVAPFRPYFAPKPAGSRVVELPGPTYGWPWQY